MAIATFLVFTYTVCVFILYIYIVYVYVLCIDTLTYLSSGQSYWYQKSTWDTGCPEEMLQGDEPQKHHLCYFPVNVLQAFAWHLLLRDWDTW